MSATLGALNPLRYRGYVYDSETGLYYLQSRYYDPELGRFINADSQLNTNSLLSYNQFAYCENSPVMYSDPCGTCKHMWFLGVGALFVDCKQCRQKQKEQLTYDNKCENKGAEINNSSSVRNSQVMREYINEKRGDEVSGTTTGVVFEWHIHNVAYDMGETLIQVGTVFNSDKIVKNGEWVIERADPLDFGNTIFDDLHGVFSYLMWGAYARRHPIAFVYDLYIHWTE